MWGELHEKKDVRITLSGAISAGEGNRLFRELGATLHYDIYSFVAEKSEIWQSEDLLFIELKNKGSEVDAQDYFDEIMVNYLLATRPSSDQRKVLNLVQKIVEKFNGKAFYQGKEFNLEQVQKDWDSCNDYLLKEWGEEPGSKSLRIMIEENYAYKSLQLTK